MIGPYAYIIMPISADPDYEEKKKRLLSAANRAEINAHFPIDDSAADKSGSFDLEKTLEDLSASAGVLADLTFERPSCYYELGLAQALRKPTVLIARSGEHIHQAHNRGSLREYVSLDDYEQLAYDAMNTLKP